MLPRNWPTRFASSVYPNPFNPATNIALSIPQSGNVRVEILTVTGKVVRVLMNEHRQAGEFELRWDGCNQQGALSASGVYLCRIQSAGRVDSRTLLLVK